MTKDYETHEVTMKHLKCSNNSNSSSSSASTTSNSSASSCSSTSSSSFQKPPHMKNKDLSYLINDLRLVCGDLCSLIKQVDLIAHRVEEKFSVIINTLENNVYSSSPSSDIFSEETGNYNNNDNNNEKLCFNNSNGKDLIMPKTKPLLSLTNEQILTEFLRNRANSKNSKPQSCKISNTKQIEKLSDFKINPLKQESVNSSNNVIYNTNNTNKIDENIHKENKRHSLINKIVNTTAAINDVEKRLSTSLRQAIIESSNDGLAVLNNNKISKNIRSKSQPTGKNQHSAKFSYLNFEESCNSNDVTKPDEQCLYASTVRNSLINEAKPMNNSQLESSFYEDKLDNELESFSCNQTTVSVDSNFSSCDNENDSKNQSQSTAEHRKIKIHDIPEILNTHSQKHHGTTKTKSSNSSTHHVCFNLNNAIYTTKTDTPIPISILKGSSTPTSVTTLLSNNNEPNTVNQCKKSIFKTNSKISSNKQQIEIIDNDNGSNSSSLSNVSLLSGKKSATDNQIKETQDKDSNANIMSSSLTSATKYGRTEPKTTIL